MKKLPLIKGKFAIVDDEDYPYLSRFRFIYQQKKDATKGSVFATLLRDKMKYVSIPMASFLMRPPRYPEIRLNHKNGNSLDFRKENLIYVKQGDHSHRGQKRRTNCGVNCTSKYKGLTRRKNGKWSVQINKDKISYRLGTFKTEEKAALIYNEKARELYGDLAYQNKIKT